MTSSLLAPTTAFVAPLSIALVLALLGCPEPKEPCVGGLPQASCTNARDELLECDTCGVSWECIGEWDPAECRWIETITPCECICADGTYLNTAEGACDMDISEPYVEDTGPYRNSCDEPFIGVDLAR